MRSTASLLKRKTASRNETRRYHLHVLLRHRHEIIVSALIYMRSWLPTRPRSMQKPYPVLQITSPAPFRVEGILLCVIALAILSFTVQKNSDSLMALTVNAIGTWIVILCFVFLFCAVLFKNIFGKEKISIVKDGAAKETINATAIMCNDLIAIEHKARPLPMSAEGKLSLLGLAGERLVLLTKTGAYRFGIGLSDAAATTAIKRIEHFCGRPLLRQAGIDQRQAAT